MGKPIWPIKNLILQSLVFAKFGSVRFKQNFFGLWTELQVWSRIFLNFGPDQKFSELQSSSGSDPFELVFLMDVKNFSQGHPNLIYSTLAFFLSSWKCSETQFKCISLVFILNQFQNGLRQTVVCQIGIQTFDNGAKIDHITGFSWAGVLAIQKVVAACFNY